MAGHVFTLDDDEKRLLEAHRAGKATEDLRKAQDSSVDLNDIRAGMTPEKKAAVMKELQRVCAELERR